MILGLSSKAHAQREALVIKIDGPITPALASFVSRGFDVANKRGSHIIILQIDTPGGLASSMRTIVKTILNSNIPVIAYVSPKGAGAASAGVLITVAAHISAMAPGTNIGAAHPVAPGGKDIDKAMTEKVINDMVSYGRSIAKERGKNADWIEKAIRKSASLTAEMALKEKVIDLMAEDLDSLLEMVNGKSVKVQGASLKLETNGCTKYVLEPTWRDRLLAVISDPNIAYILMMIGLAGIYFELSHPGSIFPGVIGGISLILAFYSFQTLPVNYAGLLLILLGVILFFAEIKIQSYGLLSVGGLISLTLGSIMLFEDLKISFKLLLPTVLGLAIFFIGVAYLAIRAISKRPVTGMEGIIGEEGVAYTDIEGEGTVFLHGEYWKATSSERISKGERVVAEEVTGLTLKVRRKE